MYLILIGLLLINYYLIYKSQQTQASVCLTLFYVIALVINFSNVMEIAASLLMIAYSLVFVNEIIIFVIFILLLFTTTLFIMINRNLKFSKANIILYISQYLNILFSIVYFSIYLSIINQVTILGYEDFSSFFYEILFPLGLVINIIFQVILSKRLSYNKDDYFERI